MATRICRVIGMLILLLGLIHPIGLSQFLWEKYVNNPVLANGTGAYSCSVLFDSASNQYRMWYTTFDNVHSILTISYATAADPIHWNDYANNPVMSVGGMGAFDSRWVTDPSVVYDGSSYKMYYTGYDGSNWRIGVATSSDGTHWTKYVGNPIITLGPGSWETVATSAPRVCIKNSIYYMIYSGLDGSTYKACLATSTDGLQWTKSAANPVLLPGNPGSWDANSIIAIAMTIHDGSFYLLYQGNPIADYGLATSVDGVEWQRYINNPLFSGGPEGSWDHILAVGALTLHGGKFHLWYPGSSHGSGWNIGYASSDLILNPTLLPPVVVASWHLDELSGTLLIDSSPYHNDGTATGTTIIQGVSGNARHFNGSSDYATVPSSTSFNFGANQSFTIEASFRSTGNGIQEIVRRGLAPVPGYLLRLIDGHVQGQVGNRLDSSPPDGIVMITSADLYNDGQWHHAALIRDREAQKLFLFVDGVRAADPVEDHFPIPIVNDRPLNIGRWDALGGVEYFSGDLDEIQISRGAEVLTPDGFRIHLSVVDAANNSGVLSFGVFPGATDGIDTAYGEYALPPVPPPGDFDFRWLINSSNGSPVDLRDTLSNTHLSNTFVGIVQPGSVGFPMTMSWNRGSLPKGTFILRDRLTHGLDYQVNMKALSSFTIADTTSLPFEIFFDNSQTVVSSMERGWNLVSPPLISSDRSTTTLFPKAASQAYAFDGVYHVAESLDYGRGYWLKFDASQFVAVTGSSRLADTIPISPGWNLIGSLSSPVAVSNIQQVPPGLVDSKYFGYRHGYRVAATLEPMSGYWVRSHGVGSLVLSASLNAVAKSLNENQDVRKFNMIRFEDAIGRSSELYFGSEEKASVNPSMSFAFPPIPPAGVFDVRYSDNSGLAVFSATTPAGQSYRIHAQSSDNPVTISWTGLLRAEEKYEILDQVTGQRAFISAGRSGSMTIENPEQSILTLRSLSRLQDPEIPLKITLEQNYPNPFNPSTNLQYAVPEKQFVSLKIYNVLGGDVATLVNEEKEPGWYSVRFDGTQLSSGIYFYRLMSRSIVQVRKMHLMK